MVQVQVLGTLVPLRAFVEDAWVVGFKKSNLVPPGTKFDFETFWRRFVEDA